MNDEIEFTLIHTDTKQLIKTYEGEYRNLMFLIKDHLLFDNFGECGGMGRCATCVVRANGVSGASNQKERNEPVTLSKMGYSDEAIRLSCQLYISKDLHGAEFTIIDF